MKKQSDKANIAFKPMSGTVCLSDENPCDFAERVDGYKICFCTDGKILFELNGRKTECTANEMLIISPGMYFSALPVEKNSAYSYVDFSGELVKNALSEKIPFVFNGDKNGAFSAVFTKNNGIDLLFKEISECKKDFPELFINSVALKILYFALEYEKKSNPSTFAYRELGENIYDILVYADENILSSDEKSIAEHFGVSYSYFSRTFGEITGLSFKEYVNFLKVNKAKKMLLKPEYEVKEISALLGFSSPSHFITVYKNITGVSPGQYGRKNKK